MSRHRRRVLQQQPGGVLRAEHLCIGGKWDCLVITLRLLHRFSPQMQISRRKCHLVIFRISHRLHRQLPGNIPRRHILFGRISQRRGWCVRHREAAQEHHAEQGNTGNHRDNRNSGRQPDFLSANGLQRNNCFFFSRCRIAPNLILFLCKQSFHILRIHIAQSPEQIIRFHTCTPLSSRNTRSLCRIRYRRTLTAFSFIPYFSAIFPTSSAR